MNLCKKQIIGMTLGGLLILLSPVIGHSQYRIGMSLGRIAIKRHFERHRLAGLDDYGLALEGYVILSAWTVGLLSCAAGAVIIVKSVQVGRSAAARSSK